MGNRHLFEKYYHGRCDFVDGTTQFHRLISEMTPHDRNLSVLEVGPSKAASLTTTFLKERYDKVCGLDVDKAAKDNPLIDEVETYDGVEMPYENNKFDFIISDYVNEHIDNPIRHFTEVSRILKKGGLYATRTPQVFNYVVVASRIIPQRMHIRIANSARNLKNHDDEVFPAVYRANTCSFYKKTLPKRVPLRCIQCRQIECEPSYVFNSKALFYLGLCHERLVNRFNWLSFLRSNIISVMEKIE